MAIGGIENNIAFLEYIGNGDWSVSELDDNSHFLGESGSLSAVYAEKLNYEAGNITTAGDVLYTQSGTYEIRDNIVSIRLNMNERPVGRIAIVGLLPTYWMEEMVEYTRLTSLTSMSWDTSVRSKGLNNRVIHGDTCVFYGILPSDNAGNTIINLINADGASHKRTYEGKQLQKGDYVILNGPGTDESTLWESNVPVKRIKAVNSSISIMVNDILQLNSMYEIFPSDATNKNVVVTSSDESIVKVNSDLTCTVLSKGTATLTIKTNDGNYSCKIDVSVLDFDSKVSFVKKGNASTIINGVVIASSVTFTISNRNDKTIHLVRIDDVLLNDGKGYDLKGNDSYECTLTANYRDIRYNEFVLHFTCEGREFNLTTK